MERIITLRIFILSILIVCTTATITTNDESGLAFLQQKSANQKPLELVFLIDRSSQTVLKEMPRLINLVDDLAKEYPDTKFGINLYADFICLQWYGPNSSHCKHAIVEGGLKVHEDPEGCYTFYKKLSNETSILKSSVKKGAIQFYPSGWYESGLAGIIMTATDKKVGWTTDSRKVIIVVTDDGTSYWPKYYGRYQPPKGDGTDTCQTMENPTADFTGEVLRKQKISLFLLLTTGGSQVNTFNQWKEVVDKMNVKYDVAYMLYPNSIIFQKIKDFLKEDKEYDCEINV